MHTRKRKLSLHTRTHTRMSLTTWHIGGYRCSDHWLPDKMAAARWSNIENYNIISRGVSQYSRFITETNVQQSEDSDFYRGICSFYPWSIISRCGLSKTTPRSVPWVWLVSSSFIRRSCRSCGLCIRDSWVCELTFHLLVVLLIFTGYKTYKVYPKSKLTNSLYFSAEFCRAKKVVGEGWGRDMGGGQGGENPGV